MFPTAPKFSKIDIYFKSSKSPKILNESISISDPPNKTFEDAAMIITGNFMLVVLEGSNPGATNLPFNYTEIFNLDLIKSYITYNS